MNEELIQALKDITDPIGAMRREVPEGCTLNGAMAVHMADSPQWYKDRAQKALDAHAARPVADAEELTKELRNFADSPNCRTDYAQKLLRSAADAIDRAAPSARTLSEAMLDEFGAKLQAVRTKLYRQEVGSQMTGPEQDEYRDLFECVGAILAATSTPAEAPSVHELDRIKRLAACGTADSFLSLPEQDKRYWFAMAIDESERRKLAEERLAFLHSTNKDADGFEYGVARVRWNADGKVEFYWALSDHSDIDAIRALQGKLEAPKGGRHG